MRKTIRHLIFLSIWGIWAYVNIKAILFMGRWLDYVIQLAKAKETWYRICGQA